MTASRFTTLRPSLIYAIACLAMIALGLASRRFASYLPTFLADYTGDTVWAAMAFFGLSMVMPRAPLRQRVWIALAFCYLVEISQLYQAPWINRIRKTTLGALVLGRGFLWSDLVCYTVGVASATAMEIVVRFGWHGLDTNRATRHTSSGSATPTTTCRRS